MAICLNMIVRNESRNLERLFASMYRYIDYYVIADTGSEDDTIEMIEALGKLYGIRGEVVCHLWQDFATNRQLAMEAALSARQEGRHECFHLMFMDADEELFVDERNWRNTLQPGVSYLVHRKLGGVVFRHLLLAWVIDDSWKWKGEIHESLENMLTQQKKVFLTSVYVRCHELQGYNFRRFGHAITRTLNDIELLGKEMQGLIPEKHNAHRFFQYALALRDAGRSDDALREFERILAAGGIQGSYRYMSLVQAARTLLQTGKENSRADRLLATAISEWPDRKEAYYYLAASLGMQGSKQEALALLEQGLAVTGYSPDGYAYAEEDIGRWKLAYERCLLLYRMGRSADASSAISGLLALDDVPDIEHRFLLSLKGKVTA